MNIFFLNRDPVQAARDHCDKHVPKMILESAQLLATALWENGIQAPYKPTHKNHPSSLWVRESNDNFIWLYTMAITLCSEYRLRFGKTHKTETVLLTLWKLWVNEKPFGNNGLTPFPQVVPQAYKQENPVSAYRELYIKDKSRFATWHRSFHGVPSWYSQSAA